MEAHESLLIYFNDEPALAVAPPRPTEARSIPNSDRWDFQAGRLAGTGVYARIVEIPPMLRSERVCVRVEEHADLVGAHRERDRSRRARMASVRTRHHKPDIARPEHHHAQDNEQPR